jgi:hypothetical protein
MNSKPGFPHSLYPITGGIGGITGFLLLNLLLFGIEPLFNALPLPGDNNLMVVYGMLGGSIRCLCKILYSLF